MLVIHAGRFFLFSIVCIALLYSGQALYEHYPILFPSYLGVLLGGAITYGFKIFEG